MCNQCDAQIQALETDLGVPLFDRLGRVAADRLRACMCVDYADQVLTLMDEGPSGCDGR